MNYYEAALKAAERIERHSDEYLFASSDAPQCGSPACMWGWLGHFAGIPEDPNYGIYTTVVTRAIGLDWMDATDLADRAGEDFTVPEGAAAALRLFAKKYRKKLLREFSADASK